MAQMIQLNLDPAQIEQVAMNPPTLFRNAEFESHHADSLHEMAMANINLWIRTNLQGRDKAWYLSENEHLLVDLETEEDVSSLRKAWIGL